MWPLAPVFLHLFRRRRPLEPVCLRAPRRRSLPEPLFLEVFIRRIPLAPVTTHASKPRSLIGPVILGPPYQAVPAEKPNSPPIHVADSQKEYEESRFDISEIIQEMAHGEGGEAVGAKRSEEDMAFVGPSGGSSFSPSVLLTEEPIYRTTQFSQTCAMVLLSKHEA